MSRVAAFFDLDGTLTTGHPYSTITRQRMRNPVGAVRAIMYLITHFAMVIPYKLGFLDRMKFFTSWGIDLSGLFKGARPSEVKAEFQASADDLLAEGRDDVLELLQKHQSQGHLIVLISGALLPLVQAVARRLGIDHVVATPLEERDGRYTGRMSGPMCFADEKGRQLTAYLESNGLDVDMRASYAYADRHYDASLLEMVGHPVAVYPDEGLLAHARERGWEIIGDTGA
jgi:HAD superfamily hydrolase (TIGR01490 family)